MTIRLTKLIISLVLLYVDRVRGCLNRILGRKLPGTCSVLYYHAVAKAHRSMFAKQMDDIIRWSKPVSAEITGPLERGVHHVAVTFDDGFVCFIENALPELIKRNIPCTIFVPTGYLGMYPGWIKNEAGKACKEIVMNAEQLRYLKKTGMVSIGSHCMTHRNLMLLDKEEAINEIINSKHDLTSILNDDIKTLSFPHGAFDTDRIEWVRQAGYMRVFTILPSLAFSNPGEYAVGRIEVGASDWPLEFRLKMFGAYRWLPIAFFLKNKARSILNRCCIGNRSKLLM